MRRDIMTLLLDNQEEILNILVSKGLIEEGAPSFSKAKITKEGRASTVKTVDVPKEFLESFRAIFPPGHKSTDLEIIDKITSFSKYNPQIPLEWDKFLSAAEHYVSIKGPFSGYAKYFFDKVEQGQHHFRILEYLEIVSDQPKKHYGGKVL